MLFKSVLPLRVAVQYGVMKIIFDNHPGVITGISERSDSSMVWWNRKPVDEMIRGNRDQFFKMQSIDSSRVVTGGTVHGTTVAVVDESSRGQYLLNTDALITNTKNLFLTITAADCMPVYFFDPITQSIGIAHAGWRGLVGGILEQVVRQMKVLFHVVPSNVRVTIGPHIGVCHFEVKDEVACQFNPENIEHRDGAIFASLAGEAAQRLRAAGVDNIIDAALCTYCHADQFFSARYDHVDPLQGMLAYIGLRP